MSEICDRLIDYSKRIESKFNSSYVRNTIENVPTFNGWSDMFWHSEGVRKCHLKIIDNRKTQKLWLMHINIFPSLSSDMPILGFDIVSGENKISGSFFDYSPVNSEHHLLNHLHQSTKGLSWSKPRELPEWAKKIFSNDMIAAGNIRGEEVGNLIEVTEKLIDHYIVLSLLEPKSSKFEDEILQKHNFYCQQQKLNPHLHRSILSMGISEEDKNDYVNRILFEEICLTSD
jgi:hypothetical protein